MGRKLLVFELYLDWIVSVSCVLVPSFRSTAIVTVSLGDVLNCFRFLMFFCCILIDEVIFNKIYQISLIKLNPNWFPVIKISLVKFKRFLEVMIFSIKSKLYSFINFLFSLRIKCFIRSNQKLYFFISKYFYFPLPKIVYIHIIEQL